MSPEHNEVTLHQILVYEISETLQHAGHADIVRELIDGVASWRPDNDNMGLGPELWESYRDRMQSIARKAVAAEVRTLASGG